MTKLLENYRASEARIQFEILKEIGARPDVFIWRQNTGSAEINGRFVRFGLPGQADIQGIWKRGGVAVPLFIEVKTATGRQSDAQRKFQAKVEAMGGVYILARSVGDVLEVLDAAA